MKPSVVAVVVVHDEPDYFSVTLSALKSQTRKVDRVIVIDTSKEDTCNQIAIDSGVDEIHRLPENYSLAQSINFAIKHVGEAQWLWLLHDDSAPNPNALELLVQAVEQSPSVAIAGPKLMQWENEKVVSQLGLSLTPFGDLFSFVNGELDQSQHDELDDVLAVGTAGALLRTDILKELDGFDVQAPALAADFDFSIRTRLAGSRVIVVPQARVVHASLSLAGLRDRKWLGASTKTALRRSAIHLRLSFSSLPVAILFWFFLPLIGLARVVGRIASKRPDRIWSEISSAAWGYFTIGARLSSRSKSRGSNLVRFSRLGSLRATWQQVRNSNRAELEKEQSQTTLAAFERGEFENEPSVRARGFFASGAAWIAVFLIAISYSYWPSAVAATGGGMLPLSESWLSLFSRAGASYQPIGLGYFAPSDPFVWVLTTLAAFTFWAPSLALAILLLLAKALAFAGAWKLTSLATESSFARIFGGLIFSLWPALSFAQEQGRIASVIAIVAMPWLVFSAARAAGIGKANFSTQTWSWVAASGLLFFVVAASSPSAILPLLVALALAIAMRIRKIGFLIWIPLPAAAIFGPTVLYYLFNIFEPFALLADPGLPLQSARLETWQLLLGGETFGLSLPFIGQISGWIAVPFVILAILSLLTKRWSVAVVIWLATLVTLCASWLLNQISFAAVGVGSTTRSNDFVLGSPAVMLSIFGLLVAVAAAITLSAFKTRRARALIGFALTLISVLPSSVLALTTNPQVQFTDGRVVPSIIAAEASQGSLLKTLVINPEITKDGSIAFGAELVTGDGVQLEDVSLSYRFALASIKEKQFGQYQAISQLVADLASANGNDLQEAIDKIGVGYVLVPDQSSSIASQLAISLDSVKELESVGSTDFGRLWRVKSPNQDMLDDATTEQSLWSITKAIQLIILLGFVLLALPTSNQRRRVSGDSQIFVGSGDESND